MHGRGLKIHDISPTSANLKALNLLKRPEINLSTNILIFLSVGIKFTWSNLEVIYKVVINSMSELFLEIIFTSSLTIIIYFAPKYWFEPSFEVFCLKLASNRSIIQNKCKTRGFVDINGWSLSNVSLARFCAFELFFISTVSISTAPRASESTKN